MKTLLSILMLANIANAAIYVPDVVIEPDTSLAIPVRNEFFPLPLSEPVFAVGDERLSFAPGRIWLFREPLCAPDLPTITCDPSILYYQGYSVAEGGGELFRLNFTAADDFCGNTQVGVEYQGESTVFTVYSLPEPSAWLLILPLIIWVLTRRPARRA